MIGATLTVLFSFTLTNINPIPQTINIGEISDPGQYVIVSGEAIDNNETSPLKVTWSIGDNPNNPADITPAWNMSFSSIMSDNSFGVSTKTQLQSGTPYYVQYSGTNSSNVTINLIGYKISN